MNAAVIIHHVRIMEKHMKKYDRGCHTDGMRSFNCPVKIMRPPVADGLVVDQSFAFLCNYNRACSVRPIIRHMSSDTLKVVFAWPSGGRF